MVHFAAPSGTNVLGAAWLQEHGEGNITEVQRDELRASLPAELARVLQAEPGLVPGVAARRHSVIQKEVERFLENGRASAGNFNRLYRRVVKLLEASELQGASGNQSRVQTASELSAPGTGTRLAPLSARATTGASEGREARLSPLPESARERRTKAHGDSGGEGNSDDSGAYTWSEVAKYRVRLELNAEHRRRQKQKEAQSAMRAALDQQVAEKQEAKKQLRHEDLQMQKHQEMELQRWQAAQDEEYEERRKKAMEVKSNRMEQVVAKTEKRNAERQRKLDDDKRLVELAKAELEMEKQSEKERKMSQQATMAALAQSWVRNKADQAEEHKKRLAEERKQLKEYQETWDRAEERKRQEMLRRSAPVAAAKALAEARTGAEVRAEKMREQKKEDHRLAQKVMQVNLLAAEHEHQKDEERREQVKKNMEYLGKQIAERQNMRVQAAEMKKRQKLEALSANLAYIEGEKSRIEEQRKRNIQHRIELEEQITFKKSQPKVNEDQMSSVEMAFNHDLVVAAQDLRDGLNTS